ncbi:hypothetical protein BD410DRAFT_825706 [Rickenella mellea]|uniref:BTB domain-containing protein n=1 Tax=Rickenella mellea TaxID=50990 RepID=A0A4Y7QGT9_9AGAM|nr:hypothetical protein BD410DRAFT_825706 [Rickenella mellea]
MATPENSDPTYHASYAFPDGDLVLQSKEGTLFRVHSLVMKLASQEPFETMLELGSKDGQENGDDARIPMFESDEVLLAMLNIIYPNGDMGQHPSSLGFAKQLLAAGDKFHMNKVVNMPACSYCFDVYAIACQYDWEEVANEATFAVLACDKKTWRTRGRSLEKESFDKLLDLHAQRKTAMKEALGFGGHYPVMWTRIKNKVHANCHKHWGPKTNRWTGWELLTLHVLLQMEMVSFGGKIRDRDFMDKDDLWSYLIEDECHECGKAEIFDKYNLHVEVIRVLNSVPKTV